VKSESVIREEKYEPAGLLIFLIPGYFTCRFPYLHSEQFAVDRVFVTHSKALPAGGTASVPRESKILEALQGSEPQKNYIIIFCLFNISQM
jgi:hypothetical protein